MKTFKVTLLRFGQVHVAAENAAMAAQTIRQNLKEEEILWLSQKDGMPGKYLITLVEPEEP